MFVDDIDNESSIYWQLHCIAPALSWLAVLWMAPKIDYHMSNKGPVVFQDSNTTLSYVYNYQLSYT